MSMLFKCLKQDASQKIILIPQLHSSKGVQKNMLKAWNFVKYKLCQSCFDNYLQKNFSTSIFESNTADTFDSCFNGQRMLRQLTDLIFKIIPSLLAATEISIHLQR